MPQSASCAPAYVTSQNETHWERGCSLRTRVLSPHPVPQHVPLWMIILHPINPKAQLFFFTVATFVFVLLRRPSELIHMKLPRKSNLSRFNIGELLVFLNDFAGLSMKQPVKFSGSCTSTCNSQAGNSNNVAENTVDGYLIYRLPRSFLLIPDLFLYTVH